MNEWMNDVLLLITNEWIDFSEVPPNCAIFYAGHIFSYVIFHVLSNLLLIYICKLHWNLIRHQTAQSSMQVIIAIYGFWFTYEIRIFLFIFFWFTYEIRMFLFIFFYAGHNCNLWHIFTHFIFMSHYYHNCNLWPIFTHFIFMSHY